MSSVISKFRRQPAWVALIIFLLLCLWVASGSLKADDEQTAKESRFTELPKVRVEKMYAEKVNRQVSLYGRTEPDRVANLRAEVKGQVEKIYAEEGQWLKKGDKILEINSSDLEAQIRSAKAVLKQREIELAGAKSLGKQGFQSQTNLAQAESNLELAASELLRFRLALSKTNIVAPFDGVLNERSVEIGDLLREGDDIAIMVDLNPLIIKADVTENVIQKLVLGQSAVGRLTSNQRVEGSIRYISSLSNVGTNTFSVEVAVDNANNDLFAGMSAQLSIPLEQTWAIKVSPAIMALDEQGNLGVKTVIQDVVHFTPINIVKSDSEGVWLTGFGDQADVITLGHGFVRDGDKVEVIRANHNSGGQIGQASSNPSAGSSL